MFLNIKFFQTFLMLNTFLMGGFMKFNIKFLNIIFAIFCTALLSCQPEEGKRGSPNAPEIVDRDSDTTFNEVPGEAHHGIEKYEEVEKAEDVNNP